MMRRMESRSIRGGRGAVSRLAWLMFCAVMAMPPAAHAQPASGVDLQEMRTSVSIFEGVLREALGLEGQQALFRSVESARVNGRYLAGQGVVVEVNAPLRIGRRGFGLRLLEDTAMALDRQLRDPGSLTAAPVSRPDGDAMRRSLALSLRRDEVGDYARGLMEQMEALDITAVDNTVRLATDALQRLHAVGEPGAAQYRRWEQELGQLRQQLAEQQQNLLPVRESVQQLAADAATISEEQRRAWEQQLARAQAAWPALRDEALETAAALRQRIAQAREQQRQEWRNEVAELEQQLFAVLCRYGATIVMPEDEYLTVVLSGLGEHGGEGPGSADRVHVLEQAALRRCQRGDTGPEALREAALSYAF